MGMLFNAQGRFDEAKEVLREAITLRKAQLGASHWMTAASELALGETYIGAGDLIAARSLVEPALLTLKEEYDAGHRLVKRATGNLRKIYTAQQDSLGLDSL